MPSRLADISSIVYGKSPADVIDRDGSVPIIGTGGEYGRASRSMFEAGIVVPRKGSLGNPQLSLDPFWATDTTFAVLPSVDTDLRWLYYCLLSYDLSRLNEATGVPSISRDWLSKIAFFNPGSLRQSKIADILQTIDHAIEKTEALIDKYQQIKAGLMHDLFTRGIGPDGQLRPPREQAPELYQETPIGWIPKDWRVVRLDEISEIVRGSTPRPAKDPKYFDGDYVPWITVGDLSRDDWPYLNATRSMLTELGSSFSRFLQQGTLVISNSGYGCGVPKILNISGCANDGVAAFLRLNPECEILYLYYYLYSQIITLRTRVARGNDQPNLNTDMLGEFEIVLPSFAEQRAVAEMLWCSELRIDAENKLRDKLLLQFSGLMHDLLTGKVPVQIESEAEPEAVNA